MKKEVASAAGAESKIAEPNTHLSNTTENGTITLSESPGPSLGQGRTEKNTTNTTVSAAKNRLVEDLVANLTWLRSEAARSGADGFHFESFLETMNLKSTESFPYVAFSLDLDSKRTETAVGVWEDYSELSKLGDPKTLLRGRIDREMQTILDQIQVKLANSESRAFYLQKVSPEERKFQSSSTEFHERHPGKEPPPSW